ncbi:MAG: hypothetical protein HYX23_02130, partial [Candidatus Zambryskibacteria bacterium]|nr:hypothetical protein [Candidatus Zambryskibacteria bacterium]
KEKLASILIAFFLWYAFVVQLGAGTITKNFQVPVEFRALSAEYLIDGINPTEVNISLSGKEQDFSFLNSAKLKVSVNLASSTAGAHKYEITNADIIGNIDTLSIVNFAPKIIKFNIKKAPPLPQEQQRID